MNLDFLSPSFSGMGFFLCMWDKTLPQPTNLAESLAHAI